jgi:hypothetical protein
MLAPLRFIIRVNSRPFAVQNRFVLRFAFEPTQKWVAGFSARLPITGLTVPFARHIDCCLAFLNTSFPQNPVMRLGGF